MWWLIDIVLLAVIVFLTIRHCIKGLMHSVYNVAKFLLALLMAVMWGKPVGAWISDSFISPKMSDFAFEKISGFIGGSESMAQFFNNIPDGFLKLMSLFGMNVDTIKDQYGNAENSEAILRDMANTISAPLSQTISSIIAYVGIFVISFLVFMLIFFLLKKIKVPVLKNIDKILGLVLGLILGILSASLIATVLYSIIEMVAAVNSNTEIMNLYNDSYIFKFIYNLKIFDFIRQLI